MPAPGDIVGVDFAGAMGIKRRPAVVVSSNLYHTHRPDIVLAALTTSLATANTPFDYLLQDWAMAGLHKPSAFRAYFNMAVTADTQFIGHLSDRDWQAVQLCLERALAIP